MFASLPIAAKSVFSVLPPSGLVLLRVAGAAAILQLVARAGGGGSGGEARAVDRRDLPRLAFYALLGVATNQLLFIEGLRRTTSIDAQVICTTIPAFAVLFAAVLGHERATLARIAGILFAASGAAYLVGFDRFHLSPETTLGNLMILVNSLSYALFLVVSKPILRKYDTLAVTAWIFLFGAFAVAPFGVAALASTNALSRMTPATWAGVAYIILVPTIGAYTLNAWALKRCSASVVAAYIYLQPIITGILAVAILGEALSERTFPAALLVFVGVALASWRSGRERRKLDEEPPEDTLGGR